MVKSVRKLKPKPIRYFYLNGNHHKVLRISRAEDIIVAWDYENKKRVSYIWSITKDFKNWVYYIDMFAYKELEIAVFRVSLQYLFRFHVLMGRIVLFVMEWNRTQKSG